MIFINAIVQIEKRTQTSNIYLYYVSRVFAPPARSSRTLLYSHFIPSRTLLPHLRSSRIFAPPASSLLPHLRSSRTLLYLHFIPSRTLLTRHRSSRALLTRHRSSRTLLPHPPLFTFISCVTINRNKT
jgi:hypothetical protein